MTETSARPLSGSFSSTISEMTRWLHAMGCFPSLTSVLLFVSRFPVRTDDFSPIFPLHIFFWVTTCEIKVFWLSIENR